MGRSSFTKTELSLFYLGGEQIDILCSLGKTNKLEVGKVYVSSADSYTCTNSPLILDCLHFSVMHWFQWLLLSMCDSLNQRLSVKFILQELSDFIYVGIQIFISNCIQNRNIPNQKLLFSSNCDYSRVEKIGNCGSILKTKLQESIR